MEDRLYENAELKKKSKREILDELVTIDAAYDLAYLSQVIQESLRFSTIAAKSSDFVVSKDVVAGNYTIKAGDALSIYINGLHFNKNEWQRPYEFLPERFDDANPLSLTPGGKKRNPFSWMPFNGGKRVCFGKTFADLNLKIAAIYMIEYFDMKLVDPKFDKNNFPMLSIGMTKILPIEVELTPYDEQASNC